MITWFDGFILCSKQFSLLRHLPRNYCFNSKVVKSDPKLTTALFFPRLSLNRWYSLYVVVGLNSVTLEIFGFNIFIDVYLKNGFFFERLVVKVANITQSLETCVVISLSVAYTSYILNLFRFHMYFVKFGVNRRT